MRWLKRLGVATVGTLTALALLAVALYGTAQTRFGRNWIAERLAAALSSPGAPATVSGLEGSVPGDLRVAEISLSDAQGVYLTIHDATLKVALGELLHRRLHVERLAAREIVLRHVPQGDGKSSGSGPLSMPQLSVAIRLDALKIESLRLAEAVLGEPVAVSISGSGGLERGKADADLAVERIDGQPGRAAFRLALGGEPLRLALDGDVAEPTGHILADLLGRNAPLPVSLKLKGDGPLATWRGDLVATAGQKAGVTATVTIAKMKRAYHVSAKGEAALADLLPPDFAALAGDKADFAADLIASDKGSYRLDRLDLNLAAGSLTGSGSYDPGSDALAAHAHLVLPALEKFGPLVGADLAGRGAVDLTVSGAMSRPKAEIAADLGDLRYAGAAAGMTSLLATLSPSNETGKFDIAGSGRVTNVAAPDVTLPGEVGSSIDWKLDGTYDSTRNRTTIREFTASAPGIDLKLAGEAAASGAAQGDVHLTIPDLRLLEALAGVKVTGVAEIDAKLVIAETGEASASLSGSIDRFATGVPAGDALLGSKVTFGAEARRGADGALTISDVTLDGPDVKLSANATLPAPADRISARWKLDVAKLDGVGRALGQQTKGRLSIAGTAEGLLTAPALQLSIDGSDIVAGAQRLDRIQAKLAMANGRQPAGKFEASFRADKLDGTAHADVAIKPNGLVAIDGIRIAAGGAAVTGNLLANPAKMTATGALTGKIPDLKPWQALAGAPIGGSADFRIALSTAKGQALDLTFTGTGLAYGDLVAVNKTLITARLDDLLGKPSGRALLDLADIRLPQGDLSSVKVNANSDKPGHFTGTIETHGQIGAKIDLVTALDATIGATEKTLKLTRFSGTVGEAKLELRKALTVAYRKDEISFSDFDLGFGSGGFSGDGSIKGQNLKLKLQAKNLPVGTIAKFGKAEDVGGTLGFEISVSGTTVKPEGHFILDAEKLQFAAASRPDLPPIGLVMEADWRNDKVDFRGRAAGNQGAALGFSGSVPLHLEPKTLAVTLPPAAAIAMKVEGDGEIANLADLLPLGEDRLSGQFHIDVTVKGTVGEPDATGTVTIARGRYESLILGTIVDNVQVELIGNRDKLQLKSFSASDSQRGRITASGAVDLAAAKGPALDFTSQISGFRVVRRDDAIASMSGSVLLKGPMTEPRLEAALTVDRADIQIPDKPSAGIGAVEVVKIDSKTGRVLADPRAVPREAQAFKLALAIKVAVSRQVFVRGRGLDSEWQGNIAIGGTSLAPEITGRLSIARGTFSFAGTNFVLSEGTIDFPGGTKIDPVIDILAQAAKNDITAKIQISGTASAPSLKLSSEPPLPQDEVLSRVLFGSSLTQITPAQGLEIAQTAAALSGHGGAGIMDRVRKKLGLDRLGVGAPEKTRSLGLPAMGGDSGANSQSGGMSGAALNAGKYVADGVYVGVSQGLSATSGQLQLQVEITPHVTVDTTVGQQGGTGVGVTWKLDY